GYYLNIERLVEFLKIEKIPVIWTFHCEFMYTGKCGHAYSCEKWKTECSKCPQLRRYPASLYFDFTQFMHRRKKQMFKDFDNLRIVTPSSWLAERVRLSFLHDKTVSVVYNGIDTTDIFCPVDADCLIDKHELKNKKIILSAAPN